MRWKNAVFVMVMGVLNCIQIAHADEVSVKAELLKKYKNLPESIGIKKMDVGGLYEVNLLGQEAYTNEKVEYLLIGGSLIDATSLVDITAQRKPQFLRDFAKSLPIQHAIKVVYGKGARKLISFEDPDCPRCKEQHAEWSKNPEKLNATVYTFMFPLKIHQDARRKAIFLWCQEAPDKTWLNWMGKNIGVPLDNRGFLVSTAPSCPAGVEHVDASEKLARSLEYHSTPRFIFENGDGADTVLSLDDFIRALDLVEKKMGTIKALDAAASAGSGKANLPLKHK